MPDWFGELLKHGDVIIANPVPFALMCVLGVAVGWAASRFFYRQELAAKLEHWQAKIEAATGVKDAALARVGQAESLSNHWRELYQAEKSRREYTVESPPRSG